MKPRRFNSTVRLLLAIGLAFLVGDRAFGWAASALVRSSEFRYSRLFRGGNDADILILGNSRGVNAVFAPAVPSLTGCSALNLSYNGAWTGLNEVLLRAYLARNAPPRLVVLEVTDLFSDDGLSLDLKPYVEESPEILRLLAHRDPVVARSAEASLLYRYNSELFFRALYYLRRGDQDWINKGRLSAAELERIPATVRAMPDALRGNLQALARVTALLEERGIAYRLLISPYLPAFADAVDGRFALAAAIRAALGKRAVLWDYERLLSSPDEFADPVHINATGNAVLMRRMQADGFFDGCAPGADKPRVAQR